MQVKMQKLAIQEINKIQNVQIQLDISLTGTAFIGTFPGSMAAHTLQTK